MIHFAPILHAVQNAQKIAAFIESTEFPNALDATGYAELLLQW